MLIRCLPRHAALPAIMLTAALLLAGCGGKTVPAPTPVPPPTPSPVVVPATGTGDAAQTALAPEDGAGLVAPSSSPSEVNPATSLEKKATAASRVAGRLDGGYTPPEGMKLSKCWLPLVERLQNDPKAPADSVRYFCSLPEYSPKPMGIKVKELFTGAFLRKKRPDDGKPKPPPSRVYRNVITAANIAKCNAYLASHKDVFDRVEQKYPVPREVLVALLYVETRLGNYVGKENAFWSLACMAAADSPQRVKGGLDGIPITQKHATWLQAKLDDKSEWAYKEMRALLAFCTANNLDPHVMPGSVYGAIGICQFMPSNLNAYGDDGDGDGVINLFSEPDAIFSAARYLTRHGWKRDMTVASQRAVLKRYNNLNIYANTILALADSVRSGSVRSAPPDKPIGMALAGKR